MKEKSERFRPYLAAAIINMTSMTLGISIGWMSPAAPALQSSEPPLGGSEPLTDSTISWLGSLQFLGAISGVIFWGQITEKLGRKAAGYIITLPLIVGWSTVLLSSNNALLLIGRFILGCSGSGALILTPSFVSDISEDSYRGTLGSFVILFFNLGVVLAYFMGAILSIKNLTLFCDLVPLVFLCFFYFLPESPVYLWTQGKHSEARESLLWYRAGNHVIVEKEVTVMETVISSGKATVPLSRLYENRGTRKAMVNSLALFAFQQFCGILMLLTYTSIILEKSNMGYSPHKAAVVIGLVQLFASWATSFIIDRINRRTLMVFSNLFMAIALIIIGLFFYLQKHSESNFLPNWTPFIAICFYVSIYCLSAPMAYIITSETLRPEVLPLAFSITIFWGTIMCFLSVKIYTFLVDTIELHGNFWFFAFWCIVAVVYTICFIPETRGKSLLLILKELNGDKETKTVLDVDYEKCDSEIPLNDEKI